MIDFKELSPNEEKVLKEILEHRLENGTPDENYWREKLENSKGQDEWTLRSVLGSLKDKELISIPMWPDGVPLINLKSRALEYFSEKERYKKEKKKENRNSMGRDIIVGLIGAIIGAIISHITDIINWIKVIIEKQ